MSLSTSGKPRERLTQELFLRKVTGVSWLSQSTLSSSLPGTVRYLHQEWNGWLFWAGGLWSWFQLELFCYFCKRKRPVRNWWMKTNKYIQCSILTTSA